METIMIDAREYSTTEELAEAMRFEQNCAVLPVIKNDILATELKIEKLKLHLDRLYKEKERTEKAINNFKAKNLDKTLIIERAS